MNKDVQHRVSLFYQVPFFLSPQIPIQESASVTRLVFTTNNIEIGYNAAWDISFYNSTVSAVEDCGEASPSEDAFV